MNSVFVHSMSSILPICLFYVSVINRRVVDIWSSKVVHGNATWTEGHLHKTQGFRYLTNIQNNSSIIYTIKPTITGTFKYKHFVYNWNQYPKINWSCAVKILLCKGNWTSFWYSNVTLGGNNHYKNNVVLFSINKIVLVKTLNLCHSFLSF